MSKRRAILHSFEAERNVHSASMRQQPPVQQSRSQRAKKIPQQNRRVTIIARRPSQSLERLPATEKGTEHFGIQTVSGNSAQHRQCLQRVRLFKAAEDLLVRKFLTLRKVPNVNCSESSNVSCRSNQTPLPQRVSVLEESSSPGRDRSPQRFTIPSISAVPISRQRRGGRDTLIGNDRC
jgi:hypothetical protein